jgi:hypothetical protein
MADEFDRFLAQALAPDEREPDRLFAAKVKARIALDQRLRAERRAIFHRLGMEVAALMVVALGLAWAGRAAPVAGLFADSPAVALALLLAAFALLVLLFSRPTDEPSVQKVELRPISNI